MEENRARQAREEAAAGPATMDTSTVEPGSASTGNIIERYMYTLLKYTIAHKV